MRKISVALGLLAVVFGSCNAQNKFKKLSSGLEYKIIGKNEGRKPAVGDFVEMHIISKLGDSTVFNSYTMNANAPVPYQVAKPAYNGDVAEGLVLMCEGDSAVFRVPADSITKMGQKPTWVKAGDFAEFRVKMVKVRTADEMRKEQDAAAAKQIGIDEGILKDYFLKNNITAQKTPGGVYYVITKPGTGANPANGQTVVANYTGKTMAGKVFDSNIDPQFQHVEPLKFPVGMGAVIKGWDEGFLALKKGDKATLFIPSSLAYGQNPPPGAPFGPNEILIFDVELLDITK
jgi:FKBP-type peptidyl-prolyl cis-trans isomerase